MLCLGQTGLFFTIVCVLKCPNVFCFISVASDNPNEEVTMDSRLFYFIGGDKGTWRVVKTSTIVGKPLLTVDRLDIATCANNQPDQPTGWAWVLRGITSNERYVVRNEKQQLLAKQQDLDRPEATRAALIPIRKNADWWALTQDERREIIEEHSNTYRLAFAICPRLHGGCIIVVTSRRTSHLISLPGSNFLQITRLNLINSLPNCVNQKSGSMLIVKLILGSNETKSSII